MTLPPFLRQADFVFVGSHPMPLQEFMPLQAFMDDLQAPIPLQLLMPAHMTLFDAAFASLVTATPPKASATAASAMLPPETRFIFMVLSLMMRGATLPRMAPQASSVPRPTMLLVIFLGSGAVTFDRPFAFPRMGCRDGASY
jgi:hypothetical protein